MAVGIMQWHARRLSPLLPCFLPSSSSSPRFKRAQAKLGIPARFNQMHLNAVAAPHMLWHQRGNKTGGLFFVYYEDFPLLEPLIYPAAGKAVARIYNRLIGSYLQRRTSKNICLHSYSRWWRLKMVRKYHNRLTAITATEQDRVVFIRLLRSFMFLLRSKP